MRCLLVYDIENDSKRSKVADACLDYGLDRIQFSAFLGAIEPTHHEEFVLKIQKLLGKHSGNVQLFPLCEKDWEARRVIAQAKEGEYAG